MICVEKYRLNDCGLKVDQSFKDQNYCFNQKENKRKSARRTAFRGASSQLTTVFSDSLNPNLPRSGRWRNHQKPFQLPKISLFTHHRNPRSQNHQPAFPFHGHLAASSPSSDGSPGTLRPLCPDLRSPPPG